MTDIVLDATSNQRVRARLCAHAHFGTDWGFLAGSKGGSVDIFAIVDRMSPKGAADFDPDKDHVGGAKNLPDWTGTKYIHVKEDRL